MTDLHPYPMHYQPVDETSHFPNQPVATACGMSYEHYLKSPGYRTWLWSNVTCETCILMRLVPPEEQL